MSKESSPPRVWRLHQQFLNPCDPKKGAFEKIWERQKANKDHQHQLKEAKKTPETNIPIPAGVFDTKEQEN